MSVKVHEAFCMDSFMDRLLWFDDFHGDQLQDEWSEGGTGSAAVVDAQTGGIVRIATGATSNDEYHIQWGENPNEIRSLLVLKKVTIETRMKLNQNTNISPAIRLYFDANNRIQFYGTATWRLFCRDGGFTTDLNTAIAFDTDYHIFRIECFPTDEVHFYIDGVETANSPITTNIPDDAADYLHPVFSVRTTEDVAKSIDIDYVYIRQER